MTFLSDGPEVDFDDLYRVWKDVASLEQTVSGLESLLDMTRAIYKKQCLDNKEYWPAGKPPSMEYLKQVVHFVGNTEKDLNHINGLENQLSEMKRQLTESKGALDTMHERIRVWQTQSANARKTLVE